MPSVKLLVHCHKRCLVSAQVHSNKCLQKGYVVSDYVAEQFGWHARMSAPQQPKSFHPPQASEASWKLHTPSHTKMHIQTIVENHKLNPCVGGYRAVVFLRKMTPVFLRNDPCSIRASPLCVGGGRGGT